MPFDKLYLKLKCNVCDGTRLHNHGHHDPHEPYKWKRCPYCDPNGHVVIEATADLVAQFLHNTDDLTKERILSKLTDITQKETS